MSKKTKGNKKRQNRQWLLLWIVIITIALGWKYPLLGYSVPLVMIAGMIGAAIRGRYVCGNLCPRGGFLDRLISKISPQKKIPDFLRTPQFRWTAFVLLMSFMGYRGFQNPTDLYHWGSVFWTMCVVTTAVAIALAIFINSRSWCSFCPMGTMQNAIGGAKDQLQINNETCKECKICEKSCPITLPIVAHKEQGVQTSRDCLKCSECIAVCPTKSLSWPSQASV